MSDSDEPLGVFEWAPPTAGLHPAPDKDGAPLSDRLAAQADDRGATAADLVKKVAREVHGWLSGPTAPDDGIEAVLASELAAVIESHGWRATVARFLAALREAAARAERTPSAPWATREAVAAECAHWRGDGAPDEVAARFGSKERCAAPLIGDALGVATGETILVHGWSETVARGLELARARGLAPSAIVSEGGADLGGRRLARRLVAGGIPVTFIYDAAIVSAVQRADRVWLGSDAIGSETFLGRVGTRALLERAHDLDVETALLATSDKFVAAPRPAPPDWAAVEAWHLWEGAPASVRVESQAFESVPLDLVHVFATDAGAFSAGQVRARALSERSYA